jgi:hypothetical protein
MLKAQFMKTKYSKFITCLTCLTVFSLLIFADRQAYGQYITTTTLTSSANPSCAADTLTLTATVQYYTGGFPGGWHTVPAGYPVEFWVFNNGAPLGSQRTTANGTATVTVPAGTFNHGFNNGTYTIRAIFEGDAAFNPSERYMNQSVNGVSINSQPASIVVLSGSTATFHVTAIGSGSIYYQWQVSTDGGVTFHDVTSGTGSTTDSYTTDTVSLADNGKQYRCVIEDSSSCDPVISNPATLIVRDEAIRPGFDLKEISRSDDSGSVFVDDIGFGVRFFECEDFYSSLYVNVNGNITFNEAYSVFTPVFLPNSGKQIIAPFWADVDPRNPDSGAVKYGWGVVDGHYAFGATWKLVGYYGEHADKLNSFQIILIDRSDTGAGNFDIEFNYDQIQWETGDASQGDPNAGDPPYSAGLGGKPARMGYANGTDYYYERPGSGVTTAFLDRNPHTGELNLGTGLIYNKTPNSSVAGRYIFPVRTLSAAPSGLVSWWQAENNANDSVSGNNGTLLNGTGFTSGKVNQTFSFDGDSQAIEIPFSESLTTPQYSIEAWIMPLDQVDNGDGQAVIFGESYGSAQLVVRPGTEGVQVVSQFGDSAGGWYGVESITDISTFEFAHVVGTWDGTTLRLYINGELNNYSVPEAYPVASGCPFYIGGFYSPAAGDCHTVSQFFNGLIDEVSYYNRALSESEIENLFNADSAGKCPMPCVIPPAGLTSWWRAENDANDSSSGGNNGTLLNGTGFASGLVNQAFSFEGPASQTAVSIPRSTSLLTATYSFETWIKPLAQPDNIDNQDWIFGQNRGRQLNIRTGSTGVNVAFQLSDYGSFHDVVSTSEIPLNQWTHVAGTWNGTTLMLYIDGVLNNATTTEAISWDSGCEFFIGGTYHPAQDGCETVGQFFTGLIDEVSYYNRPLTQCEIKAIHDAGSSGK